MPCAPREVSRCESASSCTRQATKAELEARKEKTARQRRFEFNICSEPQVRIELTTARLRIGCSTPELLWHVLRKSRSQSTRRRRHVPINTFNQEHLHCRYAQCIECPGADSNRYALRHHPLKMACLPISPPGQHHRARARANDYHCTATDYQKTTGPTGLEPATSRVTVECSNQAELRPQLLESGSETPSSLRTVLVTELVVSQPAE
jgi:hypothetical protein